MCGSAAQICKRLLFSANNALFGSIPESKLVYNSWNNDKETTTSNEKKQRTNATPPNDTSGNANLCARDLTSSFHQEDTIDAIDVSKQPYNCTNWEEVSYVDAKDDEGNNIDTANDSCTLLSKESSDEFNNQPADFSNESKDDSNNPIVEPEPEPPIDQVAEHEGYAEAREVNRIPPPIPNKPDEVQTENIHTQNVQGLWRKS